MRGFPIELGVFRGQNEPRVGFGPLGKAIVIMFFFFGGVKF